MDPNKGKLSRGLGALMSKIDKVTSGQKGDVEQEIDINLLAPNPYQPRKVFKEEEIESLANSIKENGLMSPVIVRKADDHYEIIAGERRWRAMRKLGRLKVPVIIREANQDQMITLAIIENIQREDLNPMEKAFAFKHMMEKLDLTQERLAEKLGKERSTITNFIRLTSLPVEVQDAVSRETLSMGHARSLLGVKDSSIQKELALEIIEKGYSVRQTEAKVREINSSDLEKKAGKQKDPNLYVQDVEKKLTEYLGTRVKIKKLSNKSKLMIEFYSNDDFERISRKIGFKNSL
jgi:ParB family chromosome partitioning protein